MDNKTFNDLVDSLAKVAVSCDFNIADAESSVWDGIRDAGYTWGGKPITDEEFKDAVRAATPFVTELEVLYTNAADKYMKID